ESQFLERDGEIPSHLGGQRASQFVATDLDANDIAVMADPELPESKGAERIFPTFHNPQHCWRHRASIFNPRRETRRCRLIPHAQTRIAREFTDLRLAQSRIQQRSGHLMLASRLLSWTKVALVVNIYSVGDRVKPVRCAVRFHH